MGKFKEMDLLRQEADIQEQPAPWGGLTHEEVNSWELPDMPTVFEFAKFIEAKLKEKNRG
jgi:hypothetical protein